MATNIRGRSRTETGRGDDGVRLGILPDLLGYHVRLAQVAIFAHFQGALTTLDLSPGLYAMLVIIDANPGMKQSRLAEAAKLDRSTLVPALDKLEHRQLVERRADPEDRRSNGLFLTAVGTRLLAQATEAVRAHEIEMASALSAKQRSQLITMLDQLAPEER